jgi:hypothetical protein
MNPQGSCRNKVSKGLNASYWPRGMSSTSPRDSLFLLSAISCQFSPVSPQACLRRDGRPPPVHAERKLCTLTAGPKGLPLSETGQAPNLHGHVRSLWRRCPFLLERDFSRSYAKRTARRNAWPRTGRDEWLQVFGAVSRRDCNPEPQGTSIGSLVLLNLSSSMSGHSITSRPSWDLRQYPTFTYA